MRKSYVDLCNGNFCAAALISVFEYFTNCLRETSPDAPELWIRKSYPELSLHMFGWYSVRSIQESIKFLEEHAVISVQPAAVAVGGRNSYLFDYQLVIHMLRSNTILDGNFADVPQAKLPAHAGSMAGKIACVSGGGPHTIAGKIACVGEGVYRKEELEAEKEKEAPPPHSPPNPTNAENQETQKEENSAKEEKGEPLSGHVEELTQSPETDFYLSLQDQAGEFLRQNYRRIVAQRFKHTAKINEGPIAQFQNLEETEGCRVIRSAFIAFLGDKADYLRENDWPLRVFNSQWSTWVDRIPVKSITAEAAAGRHAISTGEGATGIPRMAPSPPAAQRRGYQLCIAKWNELVPRRAVRHIAAYATETAFYDKVMVEAWEEVCHKAAAKIDQLDATAGEDSGWLTLEWVIGEKNGKPNWRKLLVQQEWKKKGRTPTYKDGKLVL